MIGSQAGILVDALEQFSRLYLQCPCDSADVGEADILATAFNAPDPRKLRCGMESGQLRQCLFSCFDSHEFSGIQSLTRTSFCLSQFVACSFVELVGCVLVGCTIVG